MRTIKLKPYISGLLLTALIIAFSASSTLAQIKIGTNGAIIAPASLLELESANQGFLLPRMANTIAIDALNPPNGMMIYKTTDPAGLYIRKNNQWEYITGSMNGDAVFNSVTVNGPVTALSFSGPLIGNASTATLATTATNSNNSAVTNDIVNPGTTYPVFVNSTPGNQPLRTSSGNLSYVPATGILTAKGFKGLLTGDVIGNASSSVDAQNAVNIRITDDVIAPETMFPTFVTANSGPLAPRVASTKLSFIPLTGELTTTTFRGALIGNASTATTVIGNVAAVNGGTGHSIYSPGDMLYASTSSALVKLPVGAPGTVLRVSSGNTPSWSTAGAGTVISVSGTNNRITVSNPSVTPILDISPNYIGQNSINTLGTITTGVWNGSVIPVASGGTGLASLPTSLLAGDGTNSISKVTGPLGYILTSTGETTLPVFKASGGGDMILASTQTVTGNKTYEYNRLITTGVNGRTATIVASTGFGSSTVELPPDGIIVNRDRIETLSSKTLISPVLVTPDIGVAKGASLITTGNITAPILVSNISTGTAPFTVNSTTPVINLSIGGNAATATTTASFSGSLAGDVTGSQNATVVSSVAGFPSVTIGARLTTVGNAVSGNTPNTLVLRGAGGNFTGGVISATEFVGPLTGSITGNAATVTTNANLTGEATSLGNDVTLTNSAVIGKKLTGYTTGTGAVGAGDNILQAIGKVEGTTNLKAPINNPSFTGTVLIPSPFNLGFTSVTTTGTQLNYLKDAAGTSGTGSVVFSASPTFTGTPTLPTGSIGFTQIAGNSTTALATTEFVTTADNLKANIASPSFTGTPLALTATAGTNTTQLATTQFVTTADNLKAPLVSPTFTGTPLAPTATAGTNTTQLATTEFVTTADNLKQGTLINSAGLLSALSDKTGTGLAVFGTNPSLIRPIASSLLADGGAAYVATKNATVGTGVQLASAVSGTNLAGTVTIEITGGVVASETLLTVDYSAAGFAGSYPVLYPATATAATLNGTNQVYATGAASGFSIKSGTGGLPNGTYTWNYHVIGR